MAKFKPVEKIRTTGTDEGGEGGTAGNWGGGATHGTHEVGNPVGTGPLVGPESDEKIPTGKKEDDPYCHPLKSSDGQCD